ncbi:MAG: hypothetical protein A2W58_03830 [Candidatus Zambryskibacteria bacterium RIFCSPHIGHO2_02_38_10.5]|uniref:Uncharacterized protein n=1 Tax=Candidatus Zambryskibacteria bacterium RIFCSPHIGHO2_02_38_10.5 TaxID=1802742 RepID=A0A1G2T8T0_9BACT|nr:MAG: hypothetical protein A2W58_03830 [Candidatus Zambryskibacteria bacterium RIFCSPHIGHO2_02_38_10.5]
MLFVCPVASRKICYGARPSDWILKFGILIFVKKCSNFVQKTPPFGPPKRICGATKSADRFREGDLRLAVDFPCNGRIFIVKLKNMDNCLELRNFFNSLCFGFSRKFAIIRRLIASLISLLVLSNFRPKTKQFGRNLVVQGGKVFLFALLFFSATQLKLSVFIITIISMLIYG